MFGYRVPAPDEAMLVSGWHSKSNTPRVIIGHGGWYMPLFSKVRMLSLSQQRVDLKEDCRTSDFITLEIEAVVAFKVSNDPASIVLAAERYITQQKREELFRLSQEVFTGHMRGIIAKMTARGVATDRETLQQEVMEGCKLEVMLWGLTIDSMQIKSIGDKNTGYYDSLAAPGRAAVTREAEIAQAQADAISQAARQKSLREQAQEQRDTEIAEAQYKAETDRAEAEAAQAGPLAQAEHQQKVIDMQRDLAQRNAQLREQQLVAEVIKPAEAAARQLKIDADAEATAAESIAKQVEWETKAAATRTKLTAEATAEAQKTTAAAQAEATRIQGQAAADAKMADAAGIRAQRLAEAEGARAMADAMAANEGAQLRMKEIEIQPQVAAAIASGLNMGGANLTILNGAEGLTQMLAGVAPLIKGMMNSLRSNPVEEYKGVPNSPASLAPNGTPVQK